MDAVTRYALLLLVVGSAPRVGPRRPGPTAPPLRPTWRVNLADHAFLPRYRPEESTGPVALPDGISVAVGASDGLVRRVSARDGRLGWTFDAGGALQGRLAVADGLLTRRPGWKSAAIIRHDDPLSPGEVVWTFYSHMAGASGKSYIRAEFPPGSSGGWVRAGQLLGYQGVWSGNPLQPGWMHLHFSVVRAAADGAFLNETVLENTLDPSPYLGIIGNADSGQANWQPMREPRQPGEERTSLLTNFILCSFWSR